MVAYGKDFTTGEQRMDILREQIFLEYSLENSEYFVLGSIIFLGDRVLGKDTWGNLSTLRDPFNIIIYLVET